MMDRPVIEYENLAHANADFMAELERAATRVIRSGWYVLGQEVKEFETEFARYVGAKHCIGVANGLDALILCIEALGLPSDSEILVASNTYIATILAIIHAGYRPVLVEPDLATYNIDPDRLAGALTPATRAICVTHLYGKSCRMDRIMQFADAHGLSVVEDCAQSHGATLHGQMTGTFGAAGCFSFYPTKNLGALGDAGAITTNDDTLADKLFHLRNYGSKVKYFNRYVGRNSRLDEMQAALLRVKLTRLDHLTLHKKQLAGAYFSHLPAEVTVPRVEVDTQDVHHIFPIRHVQRDALKAYLLEKGIRTEIHYPMAPHRQQAMQGILSGDYPIADEIHRTELSLPISYGHVEQDVVAVCKAIADFFA